MSIWKIKENTKSFESIRFHSVITKLLSLRNIKSDIEAERFFAANYDIDSYDPFLFADMEKAISRIVRAKENKEKIMIFGDYDADGITSSSILREALMDYGIEVSVYIPDKKTEGYSLNLNAVEAFAKENISLIITVDCGITSVKEIERADELGMDVIITDHHHIPHELPNAVAIINPHLENCGYPFSELAGVGVAFKLVQAIYKKLMPQKEQHTKWMLDLVAIGTVADCVPLIDENRTLVKYGLIVLSKTRRIGLQELFKVGRLIIDENNLPDSRKISFHIAPRLNAAGRIDHANLAYYLVTESDRLKARDLALELEGHNGTRQKITEQITNEVKVLAEQVFKDRKLIYASSEYYSVGVVGLVAGKIAQEFHKPTAIFQKGENESTGSFRSIPELNIIEAIEKCSDLLKKFGGHAQAAGVTVKNENFDAFFDKLEKLIEEELKDRELLPQVDIDLEILPSEIDFDLVEHIEKMQPFGEGNTEPVFMMQNVVVSELKTVGNGNKHLKMMLKAQDGSPKIFEAISFNGAEKFSFVKVGDAIDVVFTMRKDEWNGRSKIQLTFYDLRIHQ